MDKNWIECLMSRGDDIRTAEILKDGTLLRAPLHVVGDLLRGFPYTNINTPTWYFNSTFDREIAYTFDEYMVYFNPQLIWQADFQITT